MQVLTIRLGRRKNVFSQRLCFYVWFNILVAASTKKKRIRVGDKVNEVTSIFLAQLMKERSRLWGVWQTVERIIIKLFGGQKPHAAGGRSHYPVAMGVSPQGASLPLRYRHVSFILSWQYFPNLRPTILINTKVNNLTNLPHTVMF